MAKLIVAFCNFTSASKNCFFGCRTQFRENIVLVTKSSTWQTESHVTGKHGNESVTQSFSHSKIPRSSHRGDYNFIYNCYA